MEQEKDKKDEKETVNKADHTVDAQTEVAGDEVAEATADSSNGTEQLNTQLAESKDKYLRLYADFENFRRRTAKEKMEYLRQAQEDLILALLPILDDFERAQKSLDKAQDVNAVKEGIQLIYNKLHKTLEQKGLKNMESFVGKDFNAELQESIAQSPAPSEELKGKVIDELEKGYYLQDKVIRFAKVIIGS
jgi:molecular chaperone GrpE